MLVKNKKNTILVLLGCLLLTVLIYFPGLSGSFVLDDDANILRNERLVISHLSYDNLLNATLSGTAGPLKRPVSMLTFSLNLFATGKDPFYFKITNMIIHCLAGIGIFLLTRQLLYLFKKCNQPDLSSRHIDLVSGLVTLSWLLHPINLTSVLYIVQRMTSLSGLFTIWALIFFIAGRTRLLEKNRKSSWLFSGSLVCGALSILSKENGALLPLFLLAIEVTFFQLRTNTLISKTALKIFYILTIAVPLIIIVIYTIAFPDWLLSGYQIREFNLIERLLTETRVIWFYIRLIIFPDNTYFGIFHDDFIISSSLIDPLSTIFAVIGLIILPFLAIIFRKKAPILSFGLLIFLFGHVMESTILNLELVHEHRNYFASFGLLLPLFYYLTYPLKHLKTFNIRLIASFILIGLFGITTAVRADAWGNMGSLAEFQVRHHPNSARANYEFGFVNLILCKKQKIKYCAIAKNHFKKATELKANFTPGLFSLIQMAAEMNEDIETSWVVELQNRLKTRPFSANTCTALDTMVSTNDLDSRLVQNGIIGSLVYSALQNSSAKGIIKAELYTVASNYFVTRLKNNKYGLELIRTAANTLPKNPRYQMHVVKLLSIMNKPSELNKELQKLEKLDKFNEYRAEIKQIKKSHRISL